MWRVKEAETKDETHEALRGATGSGNVTLGQSATGTTTVNSLTTTITGGGAAGSITIGGSMTGTSTVLIGANCCTNIGILTTRSGFINIGTGGTGTVYLGNSSCNTYANNVYIDGATLRAPRLIAKSTTVITVVASGNYALTSITSPTGNNFDLICHVWNGDAGVQQNMVLSASVNTTTLFAMITNATPGSARISYAVYAP